MSTVSFGDKSRLIIKNIPNSLDNKSLDKLISKKCKDIGVTKCDLRLLTKEKKVNKEIKRISRGICYVGFASERDATKFLNHYDQSYFNSCKVSIEYSKAPNSDTKGEEKGSESKTSKRIEGGHVVIQKEVAPRKAGVASKQVHITFDSEESDGNEDFIDHRLDRNVEEIKDSSESINDNDKRMVPTNGFSDDVDNAPVGSDRGVDMNRVVIFNLPYLVTEEMIRNLLKPYGKIEQIHIPLSKHDYSDPTRMESKATKGMCYVTFCFESDAIKFIEQKNKTIFSGRILTITLANTQRNDEPSTFSSRIDKYYNKRRNEETYSEFKKKKRLKESENSEIWNILHIDIHAAINTITSELGVETEDILKEEEAGVNVALSESYILNKIKKWLVNQGINHEITEYNKEDLHDDILLIKNLPYNSDNRELIQLFGSCGQIIRFTTSPYNLLGLVQYSNKHECDKAFRTLSYRMFKGLPIYLQRVMKQLLPDCDKIKSDKKFEEEYVDRDQRLDSDKLEEHEKEIHKKVDNGDKDYDVDNNLYTDQDKGNDQGKVMVDKDGISEVEDLRNRLGSFDEIKDKDQGNEESDSRVGHVSVYVSNLDPNVDEEELDKYFSNLKGFVISKIIKPKKQINSNNAGFERSSGLLDIRCRSISDPSDSNSSRDQIGLLREKYAFLEFDSIVNAKEAIKKRCGTVIRGKLINLELSKNKQTISKFSKKRNDGPTEENDVIIVKNLPFQATKKELSDLFKHYANVKTVRIPKSAGNTHRGFGFVEFMSKNDAKTAMENLKNVHLYGRRLVLQYVENTR